VVVGGAVVSSSLQAEASRAKVRAIISVRFTA